MKTSVLVALLLLGGGGLVLGGCATTMATPETPLTRGALVGHWKAEAYVYTIDLQLNPDGTFETALYTFDIEDDVVKGDWNLALENRLVLTFRESKRQVYGFPVQMVRLVEEFTGKGFALRRIDTFFNPLEFVRVEKPK